MSMSDSPFILQAMCTSCYEEEVFVDKGPTLALNEAIKKGWLIGRPITIPAPRRVDYCADCAEIFTKKYVGIYCDRCGVGVISESLYKLNAWKREHPEDCFYISYGTDELDFYDDDSWCIEYTPTVNQIGESIISGEVL